MPQPCLLYLAGVLPYAEAWAWQRSLLQQRLQDPTQPDALLLLQHPPVYTLGHGASTDFLKFDPRLPPAELHRIERGGEVTYHCPGQLVGYPILNLKRHQSDLHWYLRQLEAMLIEAIAALGLEAERIEGLTGVWVEGHKVAAIGIKVSRWVTMHGFALNVCPDLAGFGAIVPCGIGDRPVGSLQQWLPNITVATAQQPVLTAFAAQFDVVFEQAPWVNLPSSALHSSTLKRSPSQ